MRPIIVFGVMGPSEVRLPKTINALFGNSMGIADSQPLMEIAGIHEYKIQGQSILVNNTRCSSNCTAAFKKQKSIMMNSST